MTLDEVIARLGVVEDRLQRLESRPAVRYQGVWNPRTQYHAGCMVTSSGSLWIAHSDTFGQKPGSVSTPWQLAAKGRS